MTPVSDVMTTPMLSVGPDGRVLGMLSLRNVMADEIDDLEHQVDALTAFEAADGIGG
jgi:hypothetical protein